MWITESLCHFQTGHWSYTANNRWKQYSNIDLSDPEPVSHLNSWYLDFSLVSITEVFSSVLSSLEWGEKPLVLSSGRGRRDALQKCGQDSKTNILFGGREARQFSQVIILPKLLLDKIMTHLGSLLINLMRTARLTPSMQYGKGGSCFSHKSGEE